MNKLGIFDFRASHISYSICELNLDILGLCKCIILNLFLVTKVDNIKISLMFPKTYQIRS